MSWFPSPDQEPHQVSCPWNLSRTRSPSKFHYRGPPSTFHYRGPLAGSEAPATFIIVGTPSEFHYRGLPPARFSIVGPGAGARGLGSGMPGARARASGSRPGARGFPLGLLLCFRGPEPGARGPCPRPGLGAGARAPGARATPLATFTCNSGQIWVNWGVGVETRARTLGHWPGPEPRSPIRAPRAPKAGPGLKNATGPIKK